MPDTTLNQELGTSGLNRFSGIVNEEFLPALQGQKATKVWTEMSDNDPIVGALLFAMDKLMRGITYSVEPFDDTEPAAAEAKFLEECMNDMSMTWADVISEIVSMFPHGWSMLEIVYKKRNGPNVNNDIDKAAPLKASTTSGKQIDAPNQSGEDVEATDEASSKFNDGRIGWRKMPIRAQETRERWQFDKNGGIRGMWQRGVDGTPVYIPIQKALLFRTSSHKNNPEGRSILRNAYRPWFFMKRIQEIEAVGIDRDLAGLPQMWVDPKYFDVNASEEQKQALKEWKDVVTKLRRDELEGLVLPALYDDGGHPLFKLELLSSGGGRSLDIGGTLQRYAQHIAMTVLADWLMLGHEGVGSFALSSDKTNLFAIALGAWNDSIVAIFNDYAVPRLFALNGKDLTKLPKIKATRIENPDLTAIGSFLSALTAAGAQLFPNDELLKRLFALANLPEPTDEVLEAMNASIEEAKTAQMGGAPGGAAPTEDEDAMIEEALKTGKVPSEA